jgi:hypothetical protein
MLAAAPDAGASTPAPYAHSPLLMVARPARFDIHIFYGATLVQHGGHSRGIISKTASGVNLFKLSQVQHYGPGGHNSQG